MEKDKLVDILFVFRIWKLKMILGKKSKDPGLFIVLEGEIAVNFVEIV
jgi:hypothetical protein